MPNIIEIIVRATDDGTDAVFDAVKAKGAAAAAAAGASMGEEMRKGIEDELPAIIPPIEDTAGTSGAAFVKTFASDVSASLGSSPLASDAVSALGDIGAPAGSQFATRFSDSVRDGLKATTITRMLDPDDALKAGQQAGQEFSDAVVDEGEARLLPGLDAAATSAGEKAGQDGGEGMSKLMVAAMAGIGAVGAPVLLAGMGAAFTGITALALKSNAAVGASYGQLGKDASDALTQATAPLAGIMLEDVNSLDQSVKGLEPDLQNLFAAAGPDLDSFTTGIEGLAANALPGMTSALSGSQSIVSDFAQALPGLGSNLGGLFDGLTRDSSATGMGLQSLIGTAGNLANTLGTVLGSSASAASSALLAIDPVVNTVSTAIRGIATPSTVGAIAGAFGAMKLDPSISSGLGSLSTGMLNISEKTAGLSGGLDAVSSGALKMSSGLDSAASVMGGPWGAAIGAGIGLAAGLASSLIQAQHASEALTLSQQGLQQAIAKDNDTAGSATAAYVLQQDTANGLASAAQAAGVSMATYTQAVFGNVQAQQQVTDASTKTAAAQQKQADAATAGATASGKYASDLQDASAAANAEPYDKAVAAQNQLTSSMKAQAAQIAQQISDQEKLTAATNTLNSTQSIFSATMKEGYQSLVASATQSADNSVAALNLGSSQTQLSMSLETGIAAYDQSTAAAQGYSTELQSLNGTAMSQAQAQTTLAQDLLNAKTSWAQNSYSLDESTQAGINNSEAAQQAATAIQAMGTATYQSTGSMNQANAVIQQQIEAYVAETGATGQAKDAIDTYINSLIKIPTGPITTTVNTDTGPAVQTVKNLVQWGNDQVVTVTVDAGGATNLLSSHGYAAGGAVSFAASGGAQAGFTWMNEQGPELVNLPTGAMVMPAANTAALMQGGAMSAPAQLMIGFEGGSDPLWQWIRQQIKVRGGNGPNSVQIALGQTS